MNILRIDSPYYSIESDNLQLNLIQKEKKRSIDLSTNVSNKIIPNLSNPTNLTNPFVVAKSKRSNKDDSNENSILSNRDYKINKLNEYNKLIFSLNSKKIQSSKSELNLLNEGIKGRSSGVIKNKKFLKPIDANRPKRNESRNTGLFDNTSPKSINYSHIKINYSIILNNNENKIDNRDNDDKKIEMDKNKDKEIELNTIWEKLKNSKMFSPMEKDKRIDRRKFEPKYPYIDIKKKINLIKYDMKLKNDRFNKIKKFNFNEISTLDNVMNNLSKSSDYIQKNYQENYVSNVLYLSRQAEKEKIINSNLLVDKLSLMKQISKLENHLNKLNEEKNNILKWIYLQIKIKEKKITLPSYYHDIIENKMNYDLILKKYKLKENILNEKEYNKIRDYKNKLIFTDIDELYKIYHNMENKIFYELNQKSFIVNDVKKLKDELQTWSKTDKEKNDKDKKDDISFEEREKEFIKELKKLKFQNTVLNDEHSKIIHYKILLNDSKKISFYNSNSDRNHLAKYEINKNEQEGNNSNLLNIAMGLYEEEINANFKNIQNKIKWKYSVSEEKMILDILEYTEKVIDFLHEEKRYYNSDEKLKNKYKLISEEIEKETKNKKLLKQLELQEQLLIARKEKIQMRLNNRNYYKPYRKVDFQFYFKEKSKKKNKKDDKVKDDENILQYFFY